MKIRHKSKKGFTLIELIVVIVVLAILAMIIVPIINSIYETANQATDNANARLIYNASAMWYSENNSANDDLKPETLVKYLGATDFPIAKSQAFAGTFSSSVTASGSITVSTTKPAAYNPSLGKLES